MVLTTFDETDRLMPEASVNVAEAWLPIEVPAGGGTANALPAPMARNASNMQAINAISRRLQPEVGIPVAVFGLFMTGAPETDGVMTGW